MNLIKCENNHFYDSDKFLSCPHCANVAAGVTVPDILGQNQNKIRTAIPQAQDIKEQQLSHGKTTGWLVCIEGEMLGESFVLREGENFIGRSASMDIALLYEPTVSREKHAVIFYNDKKNTFTLYSPGHSDQTFCNNKRIKEKQPIKNRDIITLGSCSLIFISFCNASFVWSSDEN